MWNHCLYSYEPNREIGLNKKIASILNGLCETSNVGAPSTEKTPSKKGTSLEKELCATEDYLQNLEKQMEMVNER